MKKTKQNVDLPPPDIWPMPSLKYLPKDIKREGGAHYRRRLDLVLSDTHQTYPAKLLREVFK